MCSTSFQRFAVYTNELYKEGAISDPDRFRFCRCCTVQLRRPAGTAMSSSSATSQHPGSHEPSRSCIQQLSTNVVYTAEPQLPCQCRCESSRATDEGASGQGTDILQVLLREHVQGNGAGSEERRESCIEAKSTTAVTRETRSSAPVRIQPPLISLNCILQVRRLSLVPTPFYIRIPRVPL